MATKKKSLRLLYIVRNHFTDEYRNKQTSILGVYTSLKKAYLAGHKKAMEMDQIGYKHHKMELKVVKYNTYNYVGCSAYMVDFRSEYTNAGLRRIATRIQAWFRANEQYVNEYELPIKDLFLEKPPASKEAVNHTLMLFNGRISERLMRLVRDRGSSPRMRAMLGIDRIIMLTSRSVSQPDFNHVECP